MIIKIILQLSLKEFAVILNLPINPLGYQILFTIMVVTAYRNRPKDKDALFNLILSDNFRILFLMTSSGIIRIEMVLILDLRNFGLNLNS